jgi:DNA repair protein RadC
MPIREWSEDDRPREKLLEYGEYLAKTDVAWINLRIAEQESNGDPFIVTVR